MARVEDTTVADGGSTPQERLASMWQLALDAWAMSGKPLPVYTRAEIPGVVIRKGDAGAE